MKPKILAITGSQRINGNSYQLTKTVLDSTNCESYIVQLSEKKIDYCTVCGECVNKDCVLDDNLNVILGKMNEADGIIFILPKYLLAPALFIAFLERLATITHMRKHQGYGGDLVKPEYSLFKDMKPFCIFAISGRGDFGEDLLKHITRNIEYVGLKLVKYEKLPFVAVNVLAGDSKGEVLNNTEALSQCKNLLRKLISQIKTRARAAQVV